MAIFHNILFGVVYKIHLDRSAQVISQRLYLIYSIYQLQVVEYYYFILLIIITL
nr:MAG TPA: hypothetical protein [Crassvirales sp.]